MRAERKPGEVPSGGKWEFTTVNDWLQPHPGETFEITPPLPIHEKIRNKLAGEVLDTDRWKPVAVIQQNFGGEKPSLFFVFEDPLTTSFSESIPHFSTVLKEEASSYINRHEVYLPPDIIQEALKGTNMVCAFLNLRFNAVRTVKRRAFGPQSVYVHQNGVIFFQLGFKPIEQEVERLEISAAEALDEYRETMKQAETLENQEVKDPQLFFVDPPKI